jgi:energy-coupling factor transport system ATP-binding protein
MLEAVHLSHSFEGGPSPPVWALQGATLALQAGETLLVTGPSGSGKTTLARILAGLERPRQGTVRFKGEDLYGSQGRRRQPSGQVVMAFQYPERQFFADSVWDELWWGLQAGLGLGGQEARVRLTRVAEEMDLPLAEVAQRSPRRLSSGQQRKVALASLLALEPDLLILDEPLTGLNARERRRLADLLRRWPDGNRAMLVIAHELDLFLPWTTTVAVLAAGRLVFLGSPGALAATDDPAVLSAVCLPPVMEVSSYLKRSTLSEGPVSNEIPVVVEQFRRAVKEKDTGQRIPSPKQ